MDHIPSSQCLGGLALAVANVITKGLTPNQISVLGAFLDVLADQVSLIGTINQIKCNASSESQSSEKFSGSSSGGSELNVKSDTVQKENVIKPPAKPNQPFLTQKSRHP